jgi:hypothetical protein
MDEGKIGPVFIEGGGIAIGEVKRAACAGCKGVVEVAD